MQFAAIMAITFIFLLVAGVLSYIQQSEVFFAFWTSYIRKSKPIYVQQIKGYLFSRMDEAIRNFNDTADIYGDDWDIAQKEVMSNFPLRM